MTITKTAFERVYRSELDAKIKERMLLVLNVAYHGMVAAHVARDLHRCKAWASNWLKRYDEEGIEGLRDRPKSGRHSQISEQTEYKIKTMVSLDESFFFYDSLARRVWIDEKKRPVVRVTGSHKHLCLFGATSLEGKQLFRHYERFNGGTF